MRVVAVASLLFVGSFGWHLSQAQARLQFVQSNSIANLRALASLPNRLDDLRRLNFRQLLVLDAQGKAALASTVQMTDAQLWAPLDDYAQHYASEG